MVEIQTESKEQGQWVPPEADSDSDLTISFGEDDEVRIAQPAPDTTKSLELSRVVYVFLFWVVLVYMFILTTRRKSVFVVEFIPTLPAIGFFWWFINKNTSVVKLDLVVRKFASGFTMAFWVVLFTQLILFVGAIIAVDIVAMVIRKTHCYVCEDGWYMFGLSVSTFLCFVAPEEYMKYRMAKRRSVAKGGDSLIDPKPDSRVYSIYSLAAAVGYSTMQNLFLVWLFSETRHGMLLVWAMIVLAVLLSGFSTTMHLLTAYFIGLRLARYRELSLKRSVWQTLKFPVAVRSLFFTVIITLLVVVEEITATPGEVFLGLIVVGGVGSLGLYLLHKYIQKEFLSMPSSYLQKCEYFDALGYAAVPYSSDSQPTTPTGAASKSGRDWNSNTHPQDEFGRHNRQRSSVSSSGGGGGSGSGEGEYTDRTLLTGATSLTDSELDHHIAKELGINAPPTKGDCNENRVSPEGDGQVAPQDGPQPGDTNADHNRSQEIPDLTEQCGTLQLPQGDAPVDQDTYFMTPRTENTDNESAPHETNVVVKPTILPAPPAGASSPTSGRSPTHSGNIAENTDQTKGPRGAGDQDDDDDDDFRLD